MSKVALRMERWNYLCLWVVLGLRTQTLGTDVEEAEDWSALVLSPQLHMSPPAPAECELLEGKGGTSCA